MTQSSNLFSALLQLQSAAEMQRFLVDLCTPQELKALEERWRVCQLLAKNNLSYRQIHEQTGVSLTTIGRVARFLNTEPHHGYRLALQRLSQGNFND